jgi:hypothetical protein
MNTIASTTVTTMPPTVAATEEDRREIPAIAAEEYTAPTPAQNPLGILVATLTEIATILAAAGRGNNIALCVAEQLAHEIDAAARALNALVPRPRQGRGFARWSHVEGKP